VTKNIKNNRMHWKRQSPFGKKDSLLHSATVKTSQRSKIVPEKRSVNCSEKQNSDFEEYTPACIHNNKRSRIKLPTKDNSNISNNHHFKKQRDLLFGNKPSIYKKSVLNGRKIIDKDHFGSTKIFSASSIALLISMFILSSEIVGSNMTANAMGSPQGTCGNEYNLPSNL
jgi:hypothetical protein